MDTGWDPERVYSADMMGPRDDDLASQASSVGTEAVRELARDQLGAEFRSFIKQYYDEDKEEHIYRRQLEANYEQGDYKLEVDIMHLTSFSSMLFNRLRENPEATVPVYEEFAKRWLQSVTVPRLKFDEMHDIQILFTHYDVGQVTEIRQLLAADVQKMVCIEGIVIAANRASVKATHLQLMCRNCKLSKRMTCSAGFGGATLPRVCDTNNARSAASDLPKCPLDPYQIMGDHCEYIDQQKLKLQENPESVPTGEVPRSINLACERYLVNAVKPGTRITCIGIYTSYEAQGKRKETDGVSDAGIRIPYVRVLGIQQANQASDFLLSKFTPDDEEEMNALGKTPELYKAISASMCPAIFGSDDIKKAIACMLFGGSRKHLPDGMRLRGDINVLLLGDPSCGKSQFLKFATTVAPVSVYTSGKGSSAAGLTASVLRDPGTGEFQLEGGALVLADGGLVCIDEFDKMREQDRVAIHEAMEQQTISIAKAGITTILNSRTAVLAAANPVFGRYDDMKSATENIDFQTTILSRFDLIFIIKDKLDFHRDVSIAKHVINVHKNRDAAIAATAEVVLGPEQMKKYIAYCRAKCTPRLTEAAAQQLNNRYVGFRKALGEQKRAGGTASIPITVRQLEAIIRISESLARMELSDVATEAHVNEALRLFQVSTLTAAQSDFGGAGMGGPEFMEQVKRAERTLDRRIAIGNRVSHQKIVDELVSARGFDEAVVAKAIDIMVMRKKLALKNQGKMIERLAA